MADFITSLWESVFTPGPTPTLLLATNIAFGALQVTLLGLFFATYSAHFVALSAISGGLWWAINWFSAELRQAAEIEAEADRIRKRKAGETKDALGDNTESADNEDEGARGDTETEEDGRDATPQPRRSVRTRGGPNKILGVMQSAQRAQASREQFAKEKEREATTTTKSAASGSSTQSLGPDSQILQRKNGSSADLSSSSMTDSEWEKVSKEGER